MKRIFYLAVLLVFGLGCKDANTLNNSSNDSIGDSEEMSYASQLVTKSNVRNINNASENIEITPKIIKESNLRFETSSIEKTYKSIINWIDYHDGFLQSDETTKNYGTLERRMVIRIPTKSFQSVIDSISNSVIVFDRKQISRRDVTEEFIDLEARLKAKKKLENRYLELLPKAKNVKEILEIEREIAKIREEIEAKQGRLNYLESKVSLSTIYVSFYEEIAIEKPESQSYARRILKAIKGGFTGIGEFFIGVLYLWPFIIIGGLLFILIRKRIKRTKSISK